MQGQCVCQLNVHLLSWIQRLFTRYKDVFSHSVADKTSVTHGVLHDKRSMLRSMLQ